MFRTQTKKAFRIFAFCAVVTLSGFGMAGCYSAAKPALAQQQPFANKPTLSPTTTVIQNQTAQKFLETIYANYTGNNPGISPQLPQSSKYFDPALYDLIRRDLETSNGEIPLLNFDPICACQDHDIRNLKITSKAIKGKTWWIATFDNLDTKNQIVGFDLVQKNNIWTIADINSKDLPSLRAFMVRGLTADAAAPQFSTPKPR